MATIDWSQCAALESIPGKVSRAWVFRGTRVPVSAILRNLLLPVDDLLENFPSVTRDQIQVVLEFLATSADPIISTQAQPDLVIYARTPR